MCNDAGLSQQANDGKCWGIVCLVFGILGCLSFIGGNAGGVGGVLSIIAGSMPLCCLKPDNMSCIFTASFALILIAAILDAVGAILAISLITATDSGISVACQTCYDQYGTSSSLCDLTCNLGASVGDFLRTWAFVVIGISAVLFLLHGISAYKFWKARGPAAGAGNSV
jgi:hypothetical protein